MEGAGAINRFRNVLVGVDLSAGDRLVADSLSLPSARAVEQATWLARLNGASVTFAYSLDVSERAQELIRGSENEPTVLNDARLVLEALADDATKQGVAARGEVLLGKCWVELIRQVYRGPHDLVIVGTRRTGTLSRVLIGTTGMKLLRKCPCPVWVTKPSDRPQLASVLVAHDLTPVGTLALTLGASLAGLQSAPLHVLHTLEHPEYGDMFPTRIRAEAAAERRRDARSRIEAELAGYTFARPPAIAITEGDPASRILQYVDAQGTELLVMGTIARAGVSGVITGNTAERLLPHVACSVLAVKPVDFVSPVQPPS